MNYRDHLADPARRCSVVAHRGLWQDAPENSLRAIEAAIAAGCDMVEIDVRRAADGELVVLHDDTLERMTGHPARPEDLSVVEICSLPLRNRDGGLENASTDQFVPSLRDVLDLVRGRILVHLDVKDRSVIPQVRKLCQDLRVDGQVDFWSDVRSTRDQGWISDEILAHGVPFIARVRLEQADGSNQLDLAMALKPTVCELSFTTLDQVIGVRDRILEAGTVMWVNTLDSVASAGFTDSAALIDPAGVWGRLMDAGFSCIQTDQSAALQDYRARRAGLHVVR